MQWDEFPSAFNASFKIGAEGTFSTPEYGCTTIQLPDFFSQCFSITKIYSPKVYVFNIYFEHQNLKTSNRDVAKCGAMKWINKNSYRKRDHTGRHRLNTLTDKDTTSDINMYVYAPRDNSEASVGKACNQCVCAWEFRSARSLPYLSNKA